MVGEEPRLLRRVAGPLVLVVAALLAVGCGRADDAPPDSVWVVMKNETGQHLTKIVFDHETGRIEYEIFGRDYTFGSWVRVTRDLPVRGSFYDERGVEQQFAAARPIPRDLVGGRYAIVQLRGSAARWRSPVESRPTPRRRPP
jgi:hypothetical protein